MDFVVIINLKIHEKLHLKTCRTQIITVLPLEARTFEHFSSKHFLVSSNSTWNSASYGQKIIQKVQFLGLIKVNEFWFFVIFFKNPDSFRESQVVLRKTSTFLRKEYVWVKKVSSISRFSAVNKRPLLDFKGQKGGFFEILVHK